MVRSDSVSYYEACLINIYKWATHNFEFDECVISQSVTHGLRGMQGSIIQDTVAVKAQMLDATSPHCYFPNIFANK